MLTQWGAGQLHSPVASQTTSMDPCGLKNNSPLSVDSYIMGSLMSQVNKIDPKYHTCIPPHRCSWQWRGKCLLWRCSPRVPPEAAPRRSLGNRQGVYHSISRWRGTGTHRVSEAGSPSYSWGVTNNNLFLYLRKITNVCFCASVQWHLVPCDGNDTWKSPCCHRWSCFPSWQSCLEQLVLGRRGLKGNIKTVISNQCCVILIFHWNRNINKCISSFVQKNSLP